MKRYNVRLIEADMDRRGWMKTDLAREARRSDSTIGRFLSGTRQTPRVAKDIAEALGQPIDRYLSKVSAA